MPHSVTLPCGKQVALQHPQESDIPRLYEAADASRAELAPWMDWCHPEFCITDAENWVRHTTAAEDEHSFVMIDEQSGLCLGTCGLYNIYPKYRVAKLGYWVRTGHTVQGIATAASQRVAKVAFQSLNLLRVEILVAVDNKKSHRVAQKANATREGIMRNGLTEGGRNRDAVLYSLIPGDVL